MRTNLTVDHHLVEKAQLLGGHTTPEAAVTAALEEYVQRREQVHILELIGTIDWDPTYDYKKARHRKRTAHFR